MTGAIRGQIKSRGYWRIRISPILFDKKRIPDILVLKSMVQELAVEVGSLSFPALDYGTLTIGDDWIEHENEVGDILQSWRLYQSAQLLLFEGFLDDWHDRSPFGHTVNWQPGNWLSVSDALTTYWEAFEFAARLASSIKGDDPFRVSVCARGLKGRQLKYEFRGRARLRRTYVANLESFDVTRTLSRESLLSVTSDHVVDAARELFVRFDWDVDPALLKALLAESGVQFARPAR